MKIDPVKEAANIYRTQDDWFNMDLSRRRQDQYRAPSRQPELVPVRADADQTAFASYARLAAGALTEALEAARALKYAAEAMRSGTALSAFSKRKALVSDEQAVAVSTREYARIDSYMVDIASLAQPQINMGYSLHSESPSVVSSGTNRFTFTINGHARTVSVYLPDGITTGNALLRISQAVNNAQMSVVAKVEKSREEDDAVMLRLEANQPGTVLSFTAADEYGNAMKATGAARIVQQADDTIYRINGGDELRTSSRTILLDSSRVQIEVRGVSDDPIAVTVTIMIDEQAVIRQTEQLIGSYNELLDTLDRHADILNPQVAQSLADATRRLPPGIPASLVSREEERLVLNGSLLEEWLISDADQVISGFQADNGLAALLDDVAGRLFTVPAVQLLDEQYASFGAVRAYSFRPGQSPPTRSCLPLPISGYLLNKSL